MHTPIMTKSELLTLVNEGKTKFEIAEIFSCAYLTVMNYMKRYKIQAPPGFHKKSGPRKKRRSWTYEERKVMSERSSGSKNHFYGKKHSEETKKLMRQNHQDYSGDNNPFRIACLNNPDLIKQCSENKINEWANQDPEERYNRNKKVLCGDLSRGYWTNVQNNAKNRSIEFLITPEEAYSVWINQNGLCALSGIELNLKTIYEITASLDRIDSSLGYTIDNIQWIHKQINIMKNVYSNSDLIDICYKIVETDVNKRLKKSGSQG